MSPFHTHSNTHIHTQAAINSSWYSKWSLIAVEAVKLFCGGLVSNWHKSLFFEDYIQSKYNQSDNLSCCVMSRRVIMSSHLISSNKVNFGCSIPSLRIHEYNDYKSQRMTDLTLTMISHREIYYTSSMHN